jgi:hypothetical protein
VVQREVAVLLGVSERTLIRWHKEGIPPHVFRNPTDPLKRCYYDRKEIDRLVKRLRRRKSGTFGLNLGSREVPFDPDTYEPAVPGPVAAAIYQLLTEQVPIDDICKRTGVAPEHVIRLDRLRRQFEAERVRPRAPQESESRIVMDDDAPELAAWGKALDQRKAGDASGVL